MFYMNAWNYWFFGIQELMVYKICLVPYALIINGLYVFSKYLRIVTKDAKKEKEILS